MANLLKFCMVFLLTFGSIQMSAQKIDYKEKASKENSNFFEIVKETRKQFIEKDFQAKGEQSKSTKKARKQFERWVYAWKDRVNPDGSFPNNKINKEEYLNLLLHNSNNQAKTTSTTKSWEQIGPTSNVEKNGYAAYPGLGRVNVVAVDPNNTQIMYAGACAGGVWKTTNGGSTWTPKTDNLAGLGVTDIIIDPNNSSILYMATGDEDASHISSIGVFKSTDSGETWSATGLTFTLNENEYIRDLSFAPGSSTTIFALTNNEIKKSSDSGASWTNMTTTPNYNGDQFQTMVFDPNDATKVVVSDNWGGLWYSSDSGSNFSEHSVFQGSSANKLKLTTSANDNDHFYGLLADVRDANDNITAQAKFIKYRFAIDDSANDKISETEITGFNSQRGYNQCIAVSPTNKNNILIGGVNGHRSTDNGATFSVMLDAYAGFPGDNNFYVHPDHHHLSFLADGVTVINGHDGGVHKGSFSATATSGGWTDLTNGLIISQPYNISITQALNGDDYMMGNQDNDGFSKVFQTDANKWVSCLAGDGTSTGIDISNPAIRYLGGTKGALYRSDNGYANGYNDATVILGNDNDAAFVSPLALHPTTAATIYAGHSDVKKSTDKGANWTALSSGLTETSFLDVSLFNNSAATRIFAIGQSGGNSTLKRSNDDGVSWSTIVSPTGVTINGVYAVPNSSDVYATVSSYSSGKKVYKSNDNGANWSNISGDLPNIIMYKIIKDPNKSSETLYLGTELGMYVTLNSGVNWTKLGTDLPNVRISDIEVSKNNGNVYIGTFGRGLWVYDDQKYFDNVTDSNWSVTANWEGKSLPSATDDVLLKSTENVTVNVDGATAKSLEIEDGALLTINNTRDMTVENDFTSSSSNAVIQINSDEDDSGVLIVKGTNATGKVKYVRGGLFGGNDDWTIISPPVMGQSVKTFVEDASNNIRKNTDTPFLYALAKYNDANAADSKWEYFDANVGAGVNFDVGVGYAISRASDGSVSFTGTIQKNTLNVAAAHDKWIAIGNPYSAYYPANKRDTGSLDFITNNTSKLADNAQAIYMWDDDGQKYDAVADLASSTQRVIAPGQGFFIKMKPSGTDEMITFNNLNIGTKTSLSGDHTFSKSTDATPYVKLYIESGSVKVDTDIIFSDTASPGLDIGQDIINFNSSQFDITTQLTDSSTNDRYTIQSIPNVDIGKQIIPLSVKAKANIEVTFRENSFNLPEDVKVYIEDKEVNQFFELSDNNKYKLTLKENIDGFGRFYAHFTKGTLGVLDNNIRGIKIFNHNNFIHIKGINSGFFNIEIFDLNGKRILNRNEDLEKLNPIDLNSFSKGVYLIKVSSNANVWSKKILIN